MQNLTEDENAWFKAEMVRTGLTKKELLKVFLRRFKACFEKRR